MKHLFLLLATMLLCTSAFALNPETTLCPATDSSLSDTNSTSTATPAKPMVINVIGDSYVANHARPKEETWHYKMAQELGMTYNGYGRNGSCIAFDRTHDRKSNFGPAMWQRYKDMDPDADYVLIIAGHNDANKVKNNADSLQMFADSLEVMLTNIEQHCPHARIGFVTPWYLDKPGFAQVVRVIKKACKRHHIPLLNNYNSHCVIDVRNEAFRAKYFQHPKDTAHLSADGHDLYLPVAKKWFLTKVAKRGRK